MINNTFLWYKFDKNDIQDALYGFPRIRGEAEFDLEKVRLGEGQVAIGYQNSSNDPSIYFCPLIVAVQGSGDPDVFSWLSVYSHGSFPLSQFARVVTIHDWKILHSSQRDLLTTKVREDRWACVILGEMLAQGGLEKDLTSIPLSRASGCFSATIAKVIKTYDSNDATIACSNRLKLIEKDPRFVRRKTSIDSLIPIWSLAQADVEEETSFGKIVSIIFQVVSESQFGSVGHFEFDLLESFPDLDSDSVEKRVVEFKKMGDRITDSANKNINAFQNPDIVLAAGAFLVGRGTSHVFVLQDWLDRYPSSLAWFGLFASFTGPQSWDYAWSRMTKCIEKQLRIGFRWNEPSTADISWSEYSWMTRMHEVSSPFVRFPRLQPGLLSIEVLPGVVSQLRLASTRKQDTNESEPKSDLFGDKRVDELSSALEQILRLTQSFRPLLTPGANGHTDNNMVTDKTNRPAATKNQRSKRNTKKAK